jgi:hypothetical protein
MIESTTAELHAELGALLIRNDGTHHDYGVVSGGTLDYNTSNNKLAKAFGFWKRFFTDEHGLVTTAAVNYIAADMLSASSNRINAFNFQDAGTGSVAAAIGDTALGTPAGVTRVSGTQSNPASGQYRSVATIPFTSTLAITEFGLFSAATVGTLWDRRVFSAINVSNGDSIQFTYTVTVTAGGS